MKKAISLFLCILIIFTYYSVGAAATSGKKNNSPVAETNSGDIFFNVDFAKIGQKITVHLNGHDGETLHYRWFVDNKAIDNLSDSYTPLPCDSEKMLTVKIVDSKRRELARKSIFISELPVVYIETENRKSITSKDIEINSEIKIQGNEQYNNPDILYDGKATVRGRGNTTWNDAKKPYKIKLDSKANLFGMGKNKHWVLLSNPYDQSKLKNYLGYNLAGDMGLDYIDSVFVDLVINGQPVGVYSLCEHVRIGNTRVDINDWDDIAEDAAKAIYKGNSEKMTKDERDELIEIMTDDLSWTTSDTVVYKNNTYTVSDYFKTPSINGGYLFSIDRGTDIKTNHNITYQIDKPDGISSDMISNLASSLQQFEDAIYSDDFCTVSNGEKIRYNELIDVDSFVKVILVNEIFRNADYGYRSTYMYKDIDGKIFAGPVWDLDLTADCNANTVYYNKWKCCQTEWISRLCSDPYFLNEMFKTYWKYRGNAMQKIISENGVIEATAAKLKKASAHDDSLWQYDSYYEKSVDSLREWFTFRFKWLDSQFASPETLYNSMSILFANSDLITSAAITKQANMLNIDFGSTVPKTASIYVDGKPYKNITVDSALINVEAPRSCECVTVTGYDDSSQVISGGFTSSSDNVVSLDIAKAPIKSTYNIGDKINLSGLDLKATYVDGTTATVKPDSCYSYAKDKVGLESYCLDNITSNPGNIYVVLTYKNKKVEFPVTVNGSSDYESVIELISKIPSNNFDRTYIEDVFKAEIAFNALDQSNKLKVSNADILESAMAYIDSEYVSDNTGVIYSYIDNIILDTLQNRFVMIVKGDPVRIRLYDSNSSSVTITPSSQNCISVRTVGNYTLWTCNLIVKDYTMYTLPTVKDISDPYTFNLENYTDSKDKIVHIEHTDSVFDGESCKIDILKGKFVSSVRIMENGSIISESKCQPTNSTTINLVPNGIGDHTYTLEYSTGGQFLKAADFSLYVRKNHHEPAFVNSVKISDLKINYKSDSIIIPEIDADPNTEYSVKWETSDLEIISIDDDGNIIAKKRGTATIICTANDSYGNTVTDTATVTVDYSNLQWLIIILLFGWIWY